MVIVVKESWVGVLVPEGRRQKAPRQKAPRQKAEGKNSLCPLVPLSPCLFVSPAPCSS
ncbi:hypothetical protein [[Phormidium ambiguum] IAM M-71]|uniref:hypothetical protein n=1 Tax=[Phormidium ambiguum] IAM M-71 TaxID=454136 RepID=UPI0015BF8356|nr:hypothetical protein [Phormidium ambiguum]